jgi:hypothetical protein
MDRFGALPMVQTFGLLIQHNGLTKTAICTATTQQVRRLMPALQWPVIRPLTGMAAWTVMETLTQTPTRVQVVGLPLMVQMPTPMTF